MKTSVTRAIALALTGALVAGSLCGCSLFSTKKISKWEALLEEEELLQERLPSEQIPRPTLEETAPTSEEATSDSEETEPTTTASNKNHSSGGFDSYDGTLPTIQSDEVNKTLLPEFVLPTETAPRVPEHPLGFSDNIIHPMTGSGEITASVLNIRDYPSRDAEILGGLERGTQVWIYDQVLVDGEYWGEIDEGWLNMQYVAMDGDIVGSWYYELGRSNLDVIHYAFVTFELSGDFRYVVYEFEDGQVRQLNRSGGTYQMTGTKLSLCFTYGDGEVTLGGITTSIPGNMILSWNVVGPTMTLKDARKTTLTRGTVDKLRKELEADD